MMIKARLMLVNSGTWEARLKNLHFNASLGYIIRNCLNKQTRWIARH
jgi:hypothetical protein